MDHLFTSDVAAEQVTESLEQVLDSSSVMTLATVAPASAAGVWINCAFFAYDEKFDLYFLSSPEAVHSSNLEKTQGAAASVYDAGDLGRGQKRSVQLFGEAAALDEGEVTDGLRQYSARFPAVGEAIGTAEDLRAGGSWLYRFRTTALKLFDEPRFGHNRRVSATRSAPT